MALESVSINAGTEKPIATDSIGGTLDIQVIKLNIGADGVVGDNWDGKLQGGTINLGTVSVSGGSVAVIAGTSIITSGSVAVTAGTGVVTSGSIVVTNGTIGAMPNVTLAGGTVQMMNAGTVSMVNAGTLTSVGTILGVGTVTGLGTVTALTMGTVKSDGRTARNILSSIANGTAGTVAYGTIVGSAVVGAGTSTWVTGLSVVVTSGGTVDCMLGFGTALVGSSVLTRGNFVTNSGIAQSFPLPVNCGMTNQDLVWYVGGAGTVNFGVQYFISI